MVFGFSGELAGFWMSCHYWVNINIGSIGNGYGKLP